MSRQAATSTAPTPQAPRIFSETAIKAGLLLSGPDPNNHKTPTRQCGVTLSFLEQLCMSVLHAKDKAGLRSESTATAMQRILTLSRPGRQDNVSMHASHSSMHKLHDLVGVFIQLCMACRLWDYIPQKHTGPPQWYVIHAWNGNFEEMVASLLEQLTEVDEDGDTIPGSRAGVLIWMDIFALEQSASTRMSVSDSVIMIEDIQAGCSRGGFSTICHPGN